MAVIHHVTLTVSDLAASRAWYEAVFGDAEVVEREGAGWRRLRMKFSDGLVIGVTQWAGRAAARFDPSVVGLDHLGFACADEAQVREWARRLDALGFEHGPVEDAPYAWAVTARDPDGIAIEFYALK